MIQTQKKNYHLTSPENFESNGFQQPRQVGMHQFQSLALKPTNNGKSKAIHHTQITHRFAYHHRQHCSALPSAGGKRNRALSSILRPSSTRSSVTVDNCHHQSTDGGTRCGRREPRFHLIRSNVGENSFLVF